MCGSSTDLHAYGAASQPFRRQAGSHRYSVGAGLPAMDCNAVLLTWAPDTFTSFTLATSLPSFGGILDEGQWTVPTYLLACDRQNSPIDGVGYPGRSYTAYGAVPSRIGPITGFCGQPRDARLDRYPLGNGHRRYNPILMRFHEPDALSPFGEGGINAYAYCGADPINRNDPTGRIPGAVMAGASVIQHMLGVAWTWRTWPQGGGLAVTSALSKKAGHAFLVTAIALKATDTPGAQVFTLVGVGALGTASALKHLELTLKNRASGMVGVQSQGSDSGVPLMATLPVNGPPGGLEQVVTERPPDPLNIPSDTSQRAYNTRQTDVVDV